MLISVILLLLLLVVIVALVITIVLLILIDHFWLRVNLMLRLRRFVKLLDGFKVLLIDGLLADNRLIQPDILFFLFFGTGSRNLGLVLRNICGMVRHRSHLLVEVVLDNKLVEHL